MEAAKDPRDALDADEKLAAAFVPHLFFDSQSPFRPVAAAALTDNPGNTLTRRKDVLASTSGVPVLSLARLTHDVEAGDARKGHKIREAADKLCDAARLQADPRYANRAYWRVKHRRKRIHLQYWLCFYALTVQPGDDGLAVKQEGDWRLVQVDLDTAGKPLRVAAASPTFGALRRSKRGPMLSEFRVREWRETLTDRSGRHPLLFVAPFSHAIYFEPGNHHSAGASDGSNGAGVHGTPELEPVDDWHRWSGRWGATPTSPRSPLHQRPWKKPQHVTRRGAGQWLWRQRPPAIVRLTNLAVNRRWAAAPRIEDARLERGRVAVRYGLAEGIGSVLITVHHRGEVIRAARVSKPPRTGEELIPVPVAIEDACEIRVSAVTRSGGRSEVASRELAINEPDELERSILKAIVEDQVRREEVRTFADRFAVPPGELGRGLLAMGLSERQRFWGLLARDLQEFRDARSAYTMRRRAGKEQRKARLLGGALVGVASAIVVGSLVLALFDFGLAVVVLLTAVGYGWWLPAVVVRQVRRYRAAGEVLRRWPDDAGGGEEPLGEARRRFETALREKGVAPAIREQINRKSEEVYGDRLDFGDEGLPELRVREYEVPTAATERLSALTDRMRGGSIGIAGPRGAGKTTLIAAYCEPHTTSDQRLTAIVDAPVAYDAREFVLTLYGTLCEKVLGTERGFARPPSPPRMHWGRPLLSVLALALGLLVARGAMNVLSGTAEDIALVAAAIVALAGAVVPIVLGVRAVRAVRPQSADVEAQLRARAEASLKDIRFQQSWSEGYAGKLTVSPLAVEVSERADLAQRQQTFPEIVQSFRSFLALAAKARAAVVIGIDEMDKMESADAAQKFLNEIKTVFGVGGCFFLVSISESAMSTFERRGLPFRDVFDSSFDEIIVVEGLPLIRSKALLRRRVVGLSPPFLDLCHCISGGLPRDLLRAVRQLSLLQNPNAPPSLGEASVGLVHSELIRKVAAASVAAREGGGEPKMSELMAWLAALCCEPIDAGTLMQRASSLPAGWLRTPASANGTPATPDALDELHLELAAFAYYVATVLKLFSGFADVGEHFRAVEYGEHKEASPLDQLARSRALFAVNTRVAIRAIDDFRDSRGWRTIGESLLTRAETEAGGVPVG